MDFYQFNDSISDNIGPDVQVDTLKDIGPSWLHVNSKILHAFIASTSVIVVSELGDKTFFIAAILAMKNSRIVVFVAAMLALGLMTALASVVGAATTIIPRIYIHYSAIVLSVLFGLKMLKEGYDMSPDGAKEEYDAVQSSLDKRDNSKYSSGEYGDYGDNKNYTSEDPETGVIKSITYVPIRTKLKRKLLQFVSLAFLETFTMILVAEWGDRSQISTVILAARENVIAVGIGAFTGHCICTGLAVLAGRVIAQIISVRIVTIVGGIVFLMYAVIAAVSGVD